MDKSSVCARASRKKGKKNLLSDKLPRTMNQQGDDSPPYSELNFNLPVYSAITGGASVFFSIASVTWSNWL
jgi:hypothetical protein